MEFVLGILSVFAGVVLLLVGATGLFTQIHDWEADTTEEKAAGVIAVVILWAAAAGAFVAGANLL